MTGPFLLLMAAQFLQSLAYSSMLLLPLYLDHLGASRAEIGSVMASAAVGGLALRPVVGWALDALGRKPTLIAGTLVAVGGMSLLLLVREVGILVYAMRILFGIGMGAMFSGYFTFAADLVPEARRTEGIALFGVAGLVPLALNPLAGELGVAPADIRWFLPLVGVAVLASLACLARVPEPARAVAPVRAGVLGAARDLTVRPLRPVWLATVVFSGLVALFFAFATVAAESRGVARPAAIWLTYSAGAVTVRLFGARLPDRIGPANLVAPALACYAVAALTVAGATSGDAFLAAGLLAGIGHGYTFPVLTSQVVTRVAPHRRGAGLATFTALWDASALAVAPALGAFGDRHGDRAMFALAAVGAAGTLAVWAALEHRWAAAPDPRAAAPEVAPPPAPEVAGP